MTDWILSPLAWLFARRPVWRDAFGRLLIRIGPRFYLVLALVFVLAGAWDQFARPFNASLSHSSFDWLMRNRPVAYQAAADIVVVDIDEASLAALSPHYGRWPWPRQVLAEVAATLEAVGAQAVVFDILFSDPDTANPDSEARFDAYVAASHRSFYPIVRLNPQNDSLSQISLSMLNFAQRDPLVPAAGANGARTIAMVPPYFKSIYDSARVGTTNVYPDEDNVVRWYSNYEALAGYRIPSLPYRMAQVLGWPLLAQPRGLLNWPRGATPYRTTGFASVYQAISQHDQAFLAQFADKIILIGSTAPSLNDLKATPVERLHPGIYVLATAIDNTRSHRFLRPLDTLWVFAVELVMLVVAAALFTRTNRALTVAKYFFIVPSVLVAISLISISYSDRLVDLSVPAAIALGYFAIAKLFDAYHRGFISGTGPFAPTRREVAVGRLQIACLPASVSRAGVLRLLASPGSSIKLWEPVETGFGRRWVGQGWVLWRWEVEAANAERRQSSAALGPELQWLDAPAADAPAGAFPLARIITAAASQWAMMRPANHAQEGSRR